MIRERFFKSVLPTGMKITRISVEGFKSFRKKQYLQIRPLTILAGANSSGKSSVLQPMLLLKQTLEAPFDPGPLKLDGPNVAFSRTSQMFTRENHGETQESFKFGLEYDSDNLSRGVTHRTVELMFQRTQDGRISLLRESLSEVYTHEGKETSNSMELQEGEISLSKLWETPWLGEGMWDETREWTETEISLFQARVERSRCFLDLHVVQHEEGAMFGSYPISVTHQVAPFLTNLIHIPGLRGPAYLRTYPLIPISRRFSGPMHMYVASLIHHWQQDSEQLENFEHDLRTLGLTGKVAAQAIDDTTLEIFVGRGGPVSSHNSTDLVNVADMGLGLSQVMPVLASLRAADPDHLVVIEQPELHLHPKCIYRLAEIIADAVNRNVKVIVETHSEMLLLGIQTLVAKGVLDPGKVSLNWFSLDEQGDSLIREADVKRDGSYGNWPADFMDVELVAQKEYLDAAWQQ